MVDRKELEKEIDSLIDNTSDAELVEWYEKNLQRTFLFNLRCDAIYAECLFWGCTSKDKHPITLDRLDTE